MPDATDNCPNVKNHAQGDVDNDGIGNACDTDSTPAPQCDDGRDNDGDGKRDHPADPGCESATDDSESPDPTTGGGTQPAGQE